MDAQVTNQSIELQPLQIEHYMQSKLVNLDVIKQVCLEQMAKLGFNYYSYEGYYPVCEETHGISNFPAEWQAMECNQPAALNNPIAKYSRNTTTPFFWQDIRSDSSANKVVINTTLESAEQFRIYDGICFPIHGAGAEWGMFNVARNGHRRSSALDKLQSIQLFTMTVHEAVKRACACHMKESSRRSMLSPRERECLDWIAAGKTAWETAKIIGITESTVSFHVRNTINKLNASNRAHAVALAMARSLINNPNTQKLQ